MFSFGCSREWKAEFICEIHRMKQFQTFHHLCVICLQMSTVLLNDSKSKKKKKTVNKLLKGILGSYLPGTQEQASKSVYVCVCFQRCRCCHTANSSYANSHTGSRQAPLICTEVMTNELWHRSSSSWETQVETDWVKQKVREREKCGYFSQNICTLSCGECMVNSNHWH